MQEPPTSRWADLPPVILLLGVIAFIPGGLFPFVWAKIALLGAALLLHAIVPVRRSALARADLLLLGAGLTWLTFAALTAESPLPALLGRWPRYESLPVIAAYAGSVLLGAHLLGGRAAHPGGRADHPCGRAWRLFLRAAALTALLVGAIALLEATGLRPLGGSLDIRPGSTLGNASDLGLAAVLLAAMLLPAAYATRSRLHLAGAAMAAVTVGVSGSRAALVGLLAALAVLAVGAFVARRRAAGSKSAQAPLTRAQWLTLGGIAAGAVVAALAIPAVRERLTSTYTVTGRFALWDATLDVIAARPITGPGPSGFVDALPAHLTRAAAIELGSATVHDSPHMWPLQAATAGGVILALIALALALRVLWAGIAALRTPTPNPLVLGAFAAVVGYGVATLTHFTGPGTTPLAALLAGVVIARPLTAARPTTSSPAAVAIRAVAGGAAAVLTVAALAASASEWSLKRATDDLAAGSVSAADDGFRDAEALRPWDADVALLAAQAYATAASNGVEGAAAAAIEWATRSLDAHPLSVEAGIALAVGQLNSGEPADALETLDAIDARAPHNALVHVQRGIARFGLADPEGAIADLQEAAALDPESPLAWNILARVHERLGDAEAAAHAEAEAAARS